MSDPVERILIRVVDLETTAFTPEEGGEVIEAGWTDLLFDVAGRTFEIDLPNGLWRFCPVGPIKPANQAVHHISKRELTGLPSCQPSDLKLLATGLNSRFGMTPTVLCAHNSAFEAAFMTPEIIGDARWVCTLKAALRLYPDAEAHNNHAIRYLLEIDLDERLAMPPHRAQPDSYVTANIIGRMLADGVSLRDMLRWTREPKHLPRCPIGEHKDKPWAEVPADFLQWMTTKAKNMDADTKFAAEQELARRRQPQAEQGEDY